MRFNLILGLILCIFSINEMNASTIKKDSLNPLYPDLIDAYQLKIQNLKVVRSMGKNVKLKYDIVNTGKHIVKLGKGRKIPNAMSIVFDDAIESTKMADYKAQIAEQILNQNLFIQSGKTTTQKEVKVNLNAPAKLAHLIGSDNGSRLADNTMDKIKQGVGTLGNRQGLRDDVDMDMEMGLNTEVADFDEMDTEMDTDVDMNIETEAPAFSEFTEKVTDINLPKPTTKIGKDIKRTAKINAAKNTAKKILTESSADDMLESDFEEEITSELMDEELPDDMDEDVEFGKTITTSETELISNPRNRGNTIVNKTKSYTEVDSEDGTESHTIKRTITRTSGIQQYPEDDSIIAALKKKRQAKREAAKKDAMGMKADAHGSEVYDVESEIESRELSAEELDTSADLETEKSKWYEGFKPYGSVKDDEELAADLNENGSDEFLDKSACPDLTMDELKIIKTGKKWVTVELQVTNVGPGPAMIYGKTPKEGDNVYIKAHLSGSKKISRGATTIGGMFINKGVSNKAGKLMPGESMTTQMKIDIRKKTKFTSVLILDLDAFGNCRECDETNNKQHVVLK